MGIASDDIRCGGVLPGSPAGKRTARGIMAGFAQATVGIASCHELSCGIKVGRVRIVARNTFDFVGEELYRRIGSGRWRGRHRQLKLAVVNCGHREPKRMILTQICAKIIGCGEGALHGNLATVRRIGLADSDGAVVAA
jgi:hypothetical protein